MRIQTIVSVSARNSNRKNNNMSADIHESTLIADNGTFKAGLTVYA